MRELFNESFMSLDRLSRQDRTVFNISSLKEDYVFAKLSQERGIRVVPFARPIRKVYYDIETYKSP